MHRIVQIGAVALAVAAVLADPAPARTQDAAPSESQSQVSPESNLPPWPTRLGLRIGSIRARTPTVDRVVLVPDEATFLEAMNDWSLAGRWPVLIEGDRYAPMFIRRFQPAQIMRLASVEVEAPRGADLERRMREIVRSAWSPPEPEDANLRAPNPQADEALDAREAWEAVGWRPPGVVFTSAEDPAWPAALALAADRGQPLVFLSEDFGSADDTLNDARWKRLVQVVDAGIDATGYAHDQLGDDIETITLALELAAKYRLPVGKGETLAVTDGLGRRGPERWALAGWVFGPSERAVYQAMCSIFLNHESALLYDGYPTDESWAPYALGEVVPLLDMASIKVRHVERPTAGVEDWHRLAPAGLRADLVLVNTKGHADWFDLGDGRALARDVPILATPAAVSFIHSWSAERPGDPNTIAGRWLQRGAYAYVGSVNEPYLGGFVPPQGFVKRLMGGTPFLVAARHWTLKPWKITTIGDPLMVLLRPVPRVAPDEAPLEGAIDLEAELAALTRAAMEDGDWSGVIRTAALMGRDELAARAYRTLADAEGQASAEEALAAIGPIFRTGDLPELLDAMDRARELVGSEERDLLWAKAHATAGYHDAAVLERLMGWIRTPDGWADAVSLAPHVRRRIGAAAAGALLDRYAGQADGYARRAIERAREP